MKFKWELESRCNLSCKHCIVGTTNYPQSMPLESAKKIIDKCASSGVDSIIFSTKEPFMYPHIIELIEYCFCYNILVSIITNGTLLNEEILKKIEKYASTIQYIAFSLEGVSEETNDFVRGKGVYRKVMEAVGKINAINREKETFIRTILQLNLTSVNYKEICDMVEKFNNLPFVQVTIGKLYIDGNAAFHKELNLDNDEYEKAIGTLISEYKKLENPRYELTFKDLSVYDAIYFNTVLGSSYNPNIPDCSIFYDGYSLMTDGTYCACSLLLDKGLIDNSELNLGHVDDQDKILPSRKFRRSKKMFDYKKSEICKSCRFLEKCQMCLLISLSEENRNYQISKCDFYMNKIKTIFDKIIENETYFGFNKDMIIFEEENRLVVSNSLFGENEIWSYETSDEFIKKVITYIYTKGNVLYSEIVQEFGKEDSIIMLLEECLYSSLLTITEI